MNKKIVIILLIVVVIVLVMLGIWMFSKNGVNKENPVKTDPTSDKITINDLKEELGATGNSDIYVVSEETDGRKILAVKPEIQYKVALAGILNKDETPTINNLDYLLSNTPKDNGLWISESSRENFVNIISDCTDGNYTIDDNGYLQINQERYYKL